MDITVIEGLITSLGFPIVCVVGLGWFIVKVLQKINQQNQDAMKEIQSNCKEREEKLFSEVKEVTAINGRFADIISKFDIKLDNIQKDVDDIKTRLG